MLKTIRFVSVLKYSIESLAVLVLIIQLTGYTLYR